DGRSALDAVELMDTGWNFRREHLRLAQRSHYVIVNGGDQPNVVPSEASVWYYFRELDYRHIRELYDLGNTIAEAATMMTGTTVTRRVVGSAWPPNYSKVVAEVQQKNIERVGMPQWSEADQTLARALQNEIDQPVDGLNTAVDNFKHTQTKDVQYTPLIGPDDKPAIEFNQQKMETFLPELRKVLLRSGEIQDLPGTAGDSVSDGEEVSLFAQA